MTERWSALDLSEGFQLAQAVAALQDMAVLPSLREGATARELAFRLQLDHGLLDAILQYVAERTDILGRDGDAYFPGPGYTAGSRFMIDQYIRAYGNNAAKLPALLRDPAAARGLVDQPSHARAYEQLEGPGVNILPDLVRQLDFNFLLDIGCGPGSLLLELAKSDPGFIGWGVDISPSMHEIAIRRIRALGLEKRLAIFLGDCANLADIVSPEVAKQVQTIVASSLLNEFFAVNSARAIAWLKALKEDYPGRNLLITDYYGCLGQRQPPWPRMTALHDFVQVISGQGVPPANLAKWQEIYAAAGCDLVHVVEDNEASCFVHFIRL